MLVAPLESPVVATGITALAGPRPAAAMSRIIALALVALAALTDQLAPHRGWVLLVVPASILLALQIVAALRDPQPDPRDGGVGALAAMLLAAQRLHDLEHVEVWAVAVGATSLDSIGVEDLLTTYPFERDHTLVIALEQITDGTLRYRVSAGESRREVDALVTAASASIALTISNGGPGDVGALAGPLRRRGMRAMTLYGHDERGLRRTDPQLSETAASLIVAIVGQLEDTG
ncbi:hypothetical protein K2Z83_15515 [Oscillochloris sp. ZM17-4]|uniref:hypothetical protein n=1 Tax=Oscillochloris sp. ZM17-4 TaxID=2866714 RepID=UPI001C72C64E|nr:hypothetical protein [Oscillochloris sp. ZM17-4]MBX0329086.1 hypothetical protein [Oscillochloris sp. ZM17-4]